MPRLRASGLTDADVRRATRDELLVAALQRADPSALEKRLTGSLTRQASLPRTPAESRCYPGTGSCGAFFWSSSRSRCAARRRVRRRRRAVPAAPPPVTTRPSSTASTSPGRRSTSACTRRPAATSSRRSAFPKAGSTEYQSLQQQILQSLVQRAQLDQKAPSLKVSVTDKQVEDQLKNLKKQYFGGEREELPGGAEEAVRHRRGGARRPRGEPALERDLQEGDRRRDGDARRGQGVLRRPPRGLHDAADARRQPHPREGQGARRQAVRAAEGGRRLRHAREEVLDRPRLEGAGRTADDHPRPDRARVRPGRLRAADRPAVEAGAHPVRLAHHPRRQAGHAAPVDAVLAGEGVDQAAAAPAEAERRRSRSGSTG